MPSYTLVPGKYPEKMLKTTDDKYIASDGWDIEKQGECYVLSFIDPGHGGKIVRIEVGQNVDAFARKNQPTWDEIMKYINSSA